jgi:hypothetical protein
MFYWNYNGLCEGLNMNDIIDPFGVGEIGLDEGEICNRDGCKGLMEYIKDRPCTCHTGNPPCSACTDAPLTCNKCGENA